MIGVRLSIRELVTFISAADLHTARHRRAGGKSRRHRDLFSIVLWLVRKIVPARQWPPGKIVTPGPSAKSRRTDLAVTTSN
jgi:hypothetical protein